MRILRTARSLTSKNMNAAAFAEFPDPSADTHYRSSVNDVKEAAPLFVRLDSNQIRPGTIAWPDFGGSATAEFIELAWKSLSQIGRRVAAADSDPSFQQCNRIQLCNGDWPRSIPCTTLAWLRDDRDRTGTTRPGPPPTALDHLRWLDRCRAARPET